MGVPLSILGIPLFYCLQTIENNRKTMETIDIRIFFGAIEKYYYFKYTDQIWCYYHQYSPFSG